MMDFPQTGLIAVGLGAALLLCCVVLYFAWRHLCGITSRTAELSSEYERLSVHLQNRLAAQREQARAEQATGEEKIEHLRRARDLWREASQSRRPEDEEAFETIKQTIDAIEAELTALGADPEA